MQKLVPIISGKMVDLPQDGNNLEALVYNYTQQVLQVLDAEGVVPDYIQIGNETRSNLLLSEYKTKYQYHNYFLIWDWLQVPKT